MTTNRGDGSALRAFPSRQDGDGGPLCAVCGVRLLRSDGKPCSSRARYCSERCRDEAYVRSGNGSRIRWLVEQRDGEICAACGLDCAELKRTLVSLQIKLRRDPQSAAAFWAWRWLGERLHRLGFHRLDDLWQAVGHLWEADHVVPVAEGGGGCGLDGFQTLCLPCHKVDSRRLVRRLAHGRRLAAGAGEQLVLDA